MTTWTIDQILACEPCAKYDRVRITVLFAGRETITTRDILALDIPVADRVWAALHDPIIRPRVVERIVTRAVTTHALTCGIPAVETWARRWLSGEYRTQAAARAAARAAAEAARAAAEAARAAAWAAEWARQFADIRAVLDEDDAGRQEARDV